MRSFCHEPMNTEFVQNNVMQLFSTEYDSGWFTRKKTWASMCSQAIILLSPQAAPGLPWLAPIFPLVVWLGRLRRSDVVSETPTKKNIVGFSYTKNRLGLFQHFPSSFTTTKKNDHDESNWSFCLGGAICSNKRDSKWTCISNAAALALVFAHFLMLWKLVHLINSGALPFSPRNVEANQTAR